MQYKQAKVHVRVKSRGWTRDRGSLKCMEMLWTCIKVVRITNCTYLHTYYLCYYFLACFLCSSVCNRSVIASERTCEQCFAGSRKQKWMKIAKRAGRIDKSFPSFPTRANLISSLNIYEPIIELDFFNLFSGNLSSPRWCVHETEEMVWSRAFPPCSFGSRAEPYRSPHFVWHHVSS